MKQHGKSSEEPPMVQGFQDILDLIAAVRAREWKKAVKLILKIIGDGLDTFTPEVACVSLADATATEDLLKRMETELEASSTAAFGDRFRVFLPFLMELLKRLLGGL